jgi:hypothetical protein
MIVTVYGKKWSRMLVACFWPYLLPTTAWTEQHSPARRKREKKAERQFRKLETLRRNKVVRAAALAEMKQEREVR